MFEKVNPMHPDKIADRIAGALVDIAYKSQPNPRVAVEVLIGHGKCNIIAETSVHYNLDEIKDVVSRIAKEDVEVNYLEVPQDEQLAENQSNGLRCGDNGIFKGTPVSNEQRELCDISRRIYDRYNTDGKYILDKYAKRLIICQSHAEEAEIKRMFSHDELLVKVGSNPKVDINPLGYWTGGLKTDSGATNRKLGSDMGDSVTGGGLHGKDLSKADVSVNIYAWLKAQEEHRTVLLSCGIGDKYIDGKAYSEVVEIAREFINSVGGFEKFAEWGMV